MAVHLAGLVVLRSSFIPAASLDAPHADRDCFDLNRLHLFLLKSCNQPITLIGPVVRLST